MSVGGRLPQGVRGSPSIVEGSRGLPRTREGSGPSSLPLRHPLWFVPSCLHAFCTFLLVFSTRHHIKIASCSQQSLASCRGHGTHLGKAHSDHRKSTRSSGAAATRPASPFLTTANGTGFYVVEIRIRGVFHPFSSHIEARWVYSVRSGHQVRSTQP